MTMEFEAKCKISAIGSLPFKELDKALGFVIKYFPDLPFWPQLPRLGPLEAMSVQFSENIPILDLQGSDLILKGAEESGLEEFYNKIINKDYSRFGVSKDFACGLYKFLEYLEKGIIKSDIVKGHVIGPFSLAGSIKSSKDKSIITDPELLQVISSSLTLKALWQVKLFKSFGKKTILFFDEPYLACFGSALTPLDKDTVVNVLQELIAPLKEENDCLIGVHCCGNTDWSIFIESNFDIISFDAYNYTERVMLYSKELKAFLVGGGMLALGVVPTDDFDPSKINLELLIKKVKDDLLKFSSKGIDQGFILERSLLTPSCGMGMLNEDAPVQISNLLNGLSSYLKKEYL